MTKAIILNFLNSHKQELQEKYGVKKIGLFGSYSKDKQTGQSDIDIVVDMPTNFDIYYDLKEYLEKNLQKKVDLGIEKTMRKLIKEKIKDEIIYV
jgi:hypothetical protein